VYVIIVGAGEVGSYLADRLSREGIDVAVIEKDPGRLSELEEQSDVLTVLGSGTHPVSLMNAGAEKADIIVAVTDSDESNMIASLLAKQSGIAKSVVRIQARELRGTESKKLQKAIGADMVIDPDEEAARDLLELLEFPGASEVEVLAGGEVLIIGTRLSDQSPLVGRTLLEIARSNEPHWEYLVGTITRDGNTIIPRGDHTLEAHDHLRVLCGRKARRRLMGLLGLDRQIPRHIMLLGGGRTAELVAAQLAQRGADVVVVERDARRARDLAENVRHITVLEGDITDSDVLIDGDVGSFDAVAALTGEDDANVLACLFAKSQGAAETISIAHRLELLPLLSQAGIDAALSPRTATANGVMRFVRGDIAAVTTFLEGAVEVLEFEVTTNSPADGVMVSDMHLPEDVLIGALVRDGKAQIARGHSSLRKGDRVVIFAVPSSVEEVRRRFV
jgi:trk system potassium uptake protein TrkA